MQRHDRRHHAEEQIRDVGRLAAIAGLHQLEPRFFLPDPFFQIEAARRSVFMYCFGDWRRLILVACVMPLALALPQIFSRSSATAFMRLPSESRDKQRHRQRQHRRHRGDGGKHHRQECSDRSSRSSRSSIVPPQKSKLIILFITNTPIDIQNGAKPASIRRPSGSVHSSEM